MARTTTGEGLYWMGGPFRVALKHTNSASQESVGDALASLEAFRAACQKQYIALNRMVNGRDRSYELWKGLMKSRENVIFVGTAPPDIEQVDQRLGCSCIARLSQGELLDGVAPGGWFETEHAKAFIVTIFSMWEEKYRRLVAKAMAAKKQQVMCTLMNDVRRLRNCIVHRESVIDDDIVEKLVLLPQIWKIAPGELRITEAMLHGLMEQINALRVEVVPDPSPVGIG